jgi:hypothetical protein
MIAHWTCCAADGRRLRWTVVGISRFDAKE